MKQNCNKLLEQTNVQSKRENNKKTGRLKPNMMTETGEEDNTKSEQTGELVYF